MASLRLLLFGTPRLEREHARIPVARSKGMALLAYLAVARQPQPRDVLLGLLWPEFDTTSARNNLRRELSLLKAALGDELLADRTQVALAPQSELWLDVAAFRELGAGVRRHEHPPAQLCSGCIAALEAAVELNSDDFMAGFALSDCPAFEEWQFFQREELRHELATMLQRLIAQHSAGGRFDSALAYARRWLQLDPLHEPAHRELMRLYARSGQHAAALRQYAECARLLDHELGVEPEGATGELYAAIKARRADWAAPADDTRSQAPDTAALADRAAASPANGVPAHNLQPRLTPFVGREQELAALDRYVESADVRLITLVGPGGMGKTTLALCAAERYMHAEHGAAVARFPDGIFFVPLAGLDDGAQIVHAIAEALTLQLEPERQPLRHLLEYLRRRHTLLVLDNFEQLVDGVETVEQLLRSAPGVTLLVTSRERLFLQQEYVLALGGLDFPSDEARVSVANATTYAAMQLFWDSARRVRHDFALDDAVVPPVARICRLVGGMPLAIELAASWVDTLPPAGIAAEIERGLDLLATELRNVPQRQRSMRAVFDATWQRLEPAERDVLARLAVFRGGFARAGAEHVAGATLRSLSRLLGKSLLQNDAVRDRYTMHELLRQYAAEKLAQDPLAEQAARERHSEHYTTLLGTLRADFEGAGKLEAVAAVELEYENTQLAWNYAVEHALFGFLDRASSGLEHFSYWSGRLHAGAGSFARAAQMVEASLAAQAQSDPQLLQLLARLEARRAVFEFYFQSAHATHATLERSLSLLDSPLLAGHDTRRDRAYALMKLGEKISDQQLARSYFERSLALYRELEATWSIAEMYGYLGHIALRSGELDEAQRLLDESLVWYHRSGDRWEIAWTYNGLCYVAMLERRFDEAERLGQLGLSIHRAMKNFDRVATSLLTLMWVALLAGDWSGARQRYDEALESLRELGRVNDAGMPDIGHIFPPWFVEVLTRQLEQLVDQSPDRSAEHVRGALRDGDLWAALARLFEQHQ